MKTPLSILDLSPVRANGTPAEAIRETVALAQAAEALGYRRFWVSEHHALANVAGSAPEILIAAIASKTERIRVGSGGVMLPNWSPLKVAEQFMVLEALAPGRIDLGVGRALGADVRTAGALRSSGSEVFPQYFALLCAWLLDSAGKEPFPADHRLAGVFAQPRGPSIPELFLLASSVESAAFAGMAGVGMVFAEFIAANNPVPADAAEAVAAYREAFRPSALLSEARSGVALMALAAETHDEAVAWDLPRRAAMLSFLDGRPIPSPSLDEAKAILEARADDPRLPFVIRRATVGDAGTVLSQLKAKAELSGADELFVITLAPTLEQRIESLQRLGSTL